MTNISFEILLVMTIINILAWSVLFHRFRRYQWSLFRAHLENLNCYHNTFLRRLLKIQKGLENKADIESKVALKFAEKAFNLASSANLGVMHLQKLLQVQPKLHRKTDLQKNEMTQNKVMETIGGTNNYAGFDWLYPILNEEERDLLDTAIEHATKYPAEGKEGVKVNAGHRTTTSSDI